jgi:hypothetical protein
VRAESFRIGSRNKADQGSCRSEKPVRIYRVVIGTKNKSSRVSLWDVHHVEYVLIDIHRFKLYYLPVTQRVDQPIRVRQPIQEIASAKVEYMVQWRRRISIMIRAVGQVDEVETRFRDRFGTMTTVDDFVFIEYDPSGMKLSDRDALEMPMTALGALRRDMMSCLYEPRFLRSR